MDAADNEIQEHVINGGNLDGIFEAVTEAMNESRFFQALNKRAEAVLSYILIMLFTSSKLLFLSLI